MSAGKTLLRIFEKAMPRCPFCGDFPEYTYPDRLHVNCTNQSCFLNRFTGITAAEWCSRSDTAYNPKLDILAAALGDIGALLGSRLNDADKLSAIAARLSLRSVREALP